MSAVLCTSQGDRRVCGCRDEVVGGSGQAVCWMWLAEAIKTHNFLIVWELA